MPRKLSMKEKRDLGRRYAERLKKELGEDLNAVLLFEWVFGDAPEEFDVPLVILAGDRDGGFRDPVFRIAGEVERENDYQITLTPTVRATTDFERLVKNAFPHEREMLADGYVLYDDGFFSRLRGSELGTGQRNAR